MKSGCTSGTAGFVGLALDEKVPDHSTFSKNRHGRFKESGIYQQIFDQIVLQCIEKVEKENPVIENKTTTMSPGSPRDIIPRAQGRSATRLTAPQWIRILA